MIEHVKRMLAGQFEAALCMMNDCLAKCPSDQWDGRVAKYPFWQVAYHTLCFADLYLTESEAAFALRGDLHPAGWSEFHDEFPSRRFDERELAAYLAICRQKAVETIAAETAESLGRPTGFHWLRFSRLELHVYNIRHIQHHAGQMSAFLRRVDGAIDPRWVGTGWK
jgi:hypothetical protein